MHIIQMLMKCLAGITPCNTEGVTREAADPGRRGGSTGGSERERGQGEGSGGWIWDGSGGEKH